MKKGLFMIVFAFSLLMIACNGKQDSANDKAIAQNEHGEIVPDEKDKDATFDSNEIEESESDPLKPNTPAPAISLKDIDGNMLSLSDLKGKHVVIDFWGTWCPWCIKGIPEMKEYYKKYGDKLEILSVDCGDKEIDWKDAVKEYEMTWKNVFDPDNKVAEAYGVQGFPTKVVVDTDGKFLKVFVGESEEFYQYLDSLFK